MKNAVAEPADSKSGLIDAEGATGQGAAAPLPQLQVPGVPPGALPQIDLESLGRGAEPEPFLAPTSRRDGMILGYGNARAGRVPPHGGSPSSGPLTGVPLVRTPPPTPPVFRKQALEPGHEQPDPFLRVVAAVEAPARPSDDPGLALEQLARSAADIRATRRRRPGAGAPGRVAAAAGPAGTGSAQIAASVGVPMAESVRASGRGTYVAGRARGGKWEPEASVVRDAAGPCEAPGRMRPLTPLQSLRRYAEQQSAIAGKIADEPAAGASAQPEVQPVGASGPGTKGLSSGMKGLSKAKQAEGAGPRPSLATAGSQDLDPPEKPGADERRLLALRAQVSGLAGRFGTRSRCLLDMTEALRPSPGPAKWGKEAMRPTGAPAPAKEAPGTLAVKTRAEPAVVGKGKDAGRRTAPGPGVAGSGAPPVTDRCARPQKYPARAGVGMRESAAAGVREAAPPGAPGPAQADEGIPAGRQSPPGQQAYPPQDASDSRARDEAAPGPGAGAGPRPAVAAQGMGGPSGPILLELDRMFRLEANARIDVEASAQALDGLMGSYKKAARKAQEDAKTVLGNFRLLGKLGSSAQDGSQIDAARAESAGAALALIGEIGAQASRANSSGQRAVHLLGLVNEAAKQADAALAAYRAQQAALDEKARALGNADRSTLRRRALEAAHRAERDSYRAERRALRRERGGVFMTRQFAEVEIASERAFEQEKRAARHQADAHRAKAGSAAQARAQGKADYHGSLAEAERHRAAVGRSHLLARIQTLPPVIARQRAEIHRTERDLADLNVFRATHEPKLRRVDAEIKALAETDEFGHPVADRDGKYRARDPKDAQKVRDLQRKQERLARGLRKRLGTRKGDGTWSNINLLVARQNGLAAGTRPGPFSGTPHGILIGALRRGDLPPTVRNLVEAQVNSMMDEVISDAAARSEAALEAGLAAGDAKGYLAAVAAAEEAVADIESAIKVKRDNGAYFESGWKEFDEDQKKLEKAKERLAAIKAVCDNSPRCASAKSACEARSTSEQDCKLAPPSGGGGTEGTAGGDGSSVSSVDASAPEGADAVAPPGSKEADGRDEPEPEANEEGPVTPSARQPGERYTFANDRKEPPPKEKTSLPEFEWPDFGQVLRQAGGRFVAFAAVVRSRVADAVEQTATLYREAAAEAERAEKSRVEERRAAEEEASDELKMQRAEELAALWMKVIQNLEESIAKAATKDQTLIMLRQAIRESEAARSAAHDAAKALWESVWSSAGDDEGYVTLKALERRYEEAVRSLVEMESRLRSSGGFEETDARLRAGKRLRVELDEILNLNFDALRDATDRASVEDAAKRIEQRLRWAIQFSAHGSAAIDGIRWEEDDRNGIGGGARRWVAKTWHGKSYIDVAESFASSVGPAAPPDFERDSIESIESRLRSYGDEIGKFSAIVGARGDEHANRIRLASVYFKAAETALTVATFAGPALAAARGIVGGVKAIAAGRAVALGAASLSRASLIARERLRGLMEWVGKQKLKINVKRTLWVRIERAFVTATVKHPEVLESRIIRTLAKIPGMGWLAKLQQHHIFIQRRWFALGKKGAATPSLWYGVDDLARIGLQRLGNAGWNLVPIPGWLNRLLYRVPGASELFAAGAAASVPASGYGGYKLGHWLGEDEDDAE